MPTSDARHLLWLCTWMRAIRLGKQCTEARCTWKLYHLSHEQLPCRQIPAVLAWCRVTSFYFICFYFPYVSLQIVPLPTKKNSSLWPSISCRGGQILEVSNTNRIFHTNYWYSQNNYLVLSNIRTLRIFRNNLLLNSCCFPLSAKQSIKNYQGPNSQSFMFISGLFIGRPPLLIICPVPRLQ